MKNLDHQIQDKINQKTKPVGSLGLLEEIAYQVASVQQTLTPQIINPHILVFAADHGIATEGVSKYPQEVTAQMVTNFLNGGAAINVFCQQHGIDLKIVDAGVKWDFNSQSNLINAKIGKGTKNYLVEPAMSKSQLNDCFSKAKYIIDEIAEKGCNIIGFGEMGIGNTSSASLIMSDLCAMPLIDCVGKGTGLDDQQFLNKINILLSVQKLHHTNRNVLDALQKFGGFEIAQMCSAMIRAAQKNMIILIDGFIASAAYLCTVTLHPEIKKQAIFCHQSNEKAHQSLLNFLDAKPILKLEMRLGEGTGCALAFPLIKSAVLFFNQMASFQSANVSSN
jgi:nicotinate-nucleotide--dimethylbenzimidazole phosphoribosyltransferase